MLAPVPVPVECRAGCKGEEYPLAVHVADQRREVSEILLLKHDPGAHAWFLMCEL